MKTIRNLATALTLMLASSPPAMAARAAAAADVWVSAPFASNMVLQRDLPVPVWGIAKPGEQVTVTFAGQRKQATADAQGNWSVTLDALAANREPRTMTVKAGGPAVTLENVLVGEVWLVLANKLQKQYSIDGPVPTAEVRVASFQSREISSLSPQHAYGQNRDWSSAKGGNIDAVLIPFANTLAGHLGVPIGFLRVGAGELPAMTPVDGFAAVEAMKDVAERADGWCPTTRRGRAAYEKWLADMKKWTAALEADLQPGKLASPTQPPLVPGPTPDDPTEPTVVFNQQISPLAPYAIRGAIHIDPEAGASDARYPDEMCAMAAGLRAVFKRPDMPVVFTQLAQPGMYEQSIFGNDPEFDSWYGHRDRQRRAAAAPGVGMIVTADIEDYSPYVGRRLAEWALSAAYGQDSAAAGPMYKGCRVEGDKVIVSFDCGGSKLNVAEVAGMNWPTCRADGLRYFSLAGEDRVFHTADAVIRGDTVVATCAKVVKPVAVRYACRIDPRGMNLYNEAGLPAPPFRSDNWPVESPGALAGRLKGATPAKLAEMLGDPGDALSFAAAMALGRTGQAALPTIEQLIKNGDSDQRAGSLRALGYVYWMGPIDKRKYYGVPTQGITPAVRGAVDLIVPAAKGPDAEVRLAAVEALGLIGSEDDALGELMRKLTVDDDPRIRCAALKIGKFRFNEYKHIIAMAYAFLTEKPFADRTSANIAGNLINHQRLNGPIDVKIVGRYMSRVGPGQGSGAISDLGDTLRRIKLDGREALNSPDVLPGVLNLYAIGYRNYMLYGVERWILYPENAPAFRAKIDELAGEIKRLEKDKPAGWYDLTGRYADAIDGLKAMINGLETQKAKQKKTK